MKRKAETEITDAVEYVEFIRVKEGDVAFAYIAAEKLHKGILQIISEHNMILNADAAYKKTVMFLRAVLEESVVPLIKKIKLKDGKQCEEDDFFDVMTKKLPLDDASFEHNNEIFERILEIIVKTHSDSKDEKWYEEMFQEAVSKYGSLKDSWRDAWRENKNASPFRLVETWTQEVCAPLKEIVEAKMKKCKYDYPVYPRTYGAIKIILAPDCE